MVYHICMEELSKHVVVRVTPEMYERWLEAAKADQRPLSQWIRVQIENLLAETDDDG